jgi:serine/threonine protein kinase
VKRPAWRTITIVVEHQPGVSVFAERYRVDAILGRGGMGSVSRATDIQTGATLALKQLTIPAGTNNAERRVALFQREYHILTQLNHPNLVKVFDYGLSQDIPYYTMELLGGRSLRELAPLPWRAACAYLIELCSALSVLHARGFVHRDLTPSNVLITEQSIAKLIDFGAMAPMGPNDAAVGTPPYMAFETLELSSLDGRADIFSLGALGYWALTGRHAFPAPTLASLPEFWQRAPPSASHFDPDIPRRSIS